MSFNDQDVAERPPIVDTAERGEPIHVDEVRDAREMIPVGPGGAAPINQAQQIDFAKTMSKAERMIPRFLHDHVGDCLGVVDIASRAELSPYMLARMVYVGPQGNIEFMAQAYHALAEPYIYGQLDIDFAGEGDDMVCTISGRLIRDPEKKIRTWTSPTLGKLRPAKNDKGITKGSPLWDRKPRVQMAYDTMRDWIRQFCPRATLGIYTPDERSEYPWNNSDMSQVIDQVAEEFKARLATADRTEGHKPGSTAAELDNVAAGGPVKITPAADPPRTESLADPKRIAAARRVAKAAADRADAASKKAKAKPRPAERSPQVKQAADRAEASSRAKTPKPEPEQPAPEPALETTLPETTLPELETTLPAPEPEPEIMPPAPPQPPTNAAEYMAYALAWIDRVNNADDAAARWDGERDTRDALSVPIADRAKLQDMLRVKFPE